MSEIRGQFLTRIASITGCASKSNFLSATAALLLGGAAGVPFQAHAQHGISLWTNSYDGGSDDLVGAIAVDRSGNVFLTGRSWGPGPYGNAYCFATVAYTSDGLAMWTNRYHGPANSWDGANAIATDTNG